MLINKKSLLFGLWIVVLAVLAFVSNKLSESSSMRIPPTVPPPNAPKPIDAKSAQKNWDAIIKHAAGPPRGPNDAPYAMVEFGDFECPPCGHIRPRIEEAMVGAPVQLYFVQRPLPQVGHTLAEPAACAALAAAAQGKFWPMYDALYSHQKDLNPRNYGTYAAAAGLDGKSLQKDVESNRYLRQVQESEQFCDSIGVNGTPTVLVRNNKTGEILVASNRKPIEALLFHGPFSKNPSPKLVAAAIAKGH